jgi:hypothetical protein
MFINQLVIINLLSDIGWTIMTSGFSLVLYSRLHLVNPGKKLLRTALTVIIVDSTIIHSLIFFSIIYSIVHSTAVVWRAFSDICFLEVVFTLQETALSTCYVYFFLQYTADSRAEPQAKAVTRFLIGVELLVFGTDIVLNILLFQRLYLPRSMIEPFCAMLKLKIEFMILNSMVEYSQSVSTRTALPSWRIQREGGQSSSVEVPQNPHLASVVASSEQQSGLYGEPSQTKAAVGVGTEKAHVEGRNWQATPL